MRGQRTIAVIAMVISIVILVNKLLTSAPVQIIIEGGYAIPVRGAVYFTVEDVLVLVVCAWIGGMSVVYLLMVRTKEPLEIPRDAEKVRKKVEVALQMLEGDEKILLKEISDSSSEIAQSDLVVKTGFSEAKISRLLDKLESRGLVVRRRYGMGNMVMLKKDY
jgi:uncharacterized membrane protein